MASDQLYLFKKRRFLPLFLVQLCGALNDNIIKNSLIILIIFKLANSAIMDSGTLILLANILFIAPFLLFASIAGEASDKYERTYVVRIVKMAEIAIIFWALYGFRSENIVVLLSCITLMGVHSTFFGPIKYSSLTDHLDKTELVGANGFVEAGTFLSILIGTIIGNYYNASNGFVLNAMIFIAIFGFVSCLFMPKSGNSNNNIKINFNIIEGTRDMMSYAKSKVNVYLAILGISWFWFIGAVFLTQLPLLTRNVLGANEAVYTLFLAVFSIGVGFGSFMCHKIFDGKITTKYVFACALGISIFSVDLFFATRIATSHYYSDTASLKTVIEFVSKLHYWRILVDLFMISAISGLYVVPLYAVMQYFSSPNRRSIIIAANNFMNSVFMCGATLSLMLLSYVGFSIPYVILIVAIVNIVIAAFIHKFIPENKIVPAKLWRSIFKYIFDKLYKIEVNGLENFRLAGDRTVIIANHLSYLDPGLIAAHIPEELKFAINTGVSQKWWVRPFLGIVDTFPVDQTNPMAIKSLIAEVKKKQKIAIFPEGRTSVTGALMKIYEGPGMIADKADASILPIRVDGTQFTIFSKIRSMMKNGFAFRRTLTVTILPPVKISPPEDLTARERRKFIGDRLYDIMSDMMFESSNYQDCLFNSLLQASDTYGSKSVIAEDINNNNATYKSLIMKSFVLANVFTKYNNDEKYIGLMLPNTVANLVSFFGLQAVGKVPAMINFTSGIKNIISSCNTTDIKTIYTSKLFVSKANLEDLVDNLKQNNINVIYLEDLKNKISIFTKLKCFFVASWCPEFYYDLLCKIKDYSDAAVILFTSGTEGAPKAVALSHQNILSNKCQIDARIDLTRNDLAFNALPMFHSFGLTCSILMSLNGIKTFFYPSPLHYRVIPEVIYDIGATILFGTDTFLNGYAKNAHPYDFYSLRYVVAGAEKLKNHTKKIWLDKFGIRIFEGYGVTEASPVLAVNTPMHNKSGSVGRLLPKIINRLKPVEGIAEGGELCVKGPNIMLGYIKADNPGKITPTCVDGLGDGWYNTGDIVTIDEDGYVTIQGRSKRFAKIAGEMVSLAAIEESIINYLPHEVVAAISKPDDKKGEQIILFVQNKDITRDVIQKIIKDNDLSELYLPKEVVCLKEIPILTTGKIDYKSLNLL